MKVRDFDYIETRLLAPLGESTEACARLQEVGRPDLAERVMAAAQAFTDECRAVRQEIQGQRGTPEARVDPDPQDLVVTYGERWRGDARGYVLVTRGRPRVVVFQSDSKTTVIAEAQRRKGWVPADGSEETYARQISEHDGESR